MKPLFNLEAKEEKILFESCVVTTPRMQNKDAQT
jgi:hypothetical protein